MSFHRNPITVGNYLYFQPPIGRGSYSKVYLGKNVNTNEKVAIKRIKLRSIKQYSADRIQKEIKLLRMLKHPNIIEFRDVLTDANNIYIITEHCNGGDFNKLIERQLDEDEAKVCMCGLRDGLKYLQSRYIVHRDLKPQNMLISYTKGKDQVMEHLCLKIADFGFAKCFNREITEFENTNTREDIQDDHEASEDMFATLCGTPLYMAPEIITDKKYHLVSDLWSIGVILYQIIYGRFPFGKPRNILELIHNIGSTELNLTNNTYEISFNCQDLIKRLLEKNPTKRITWEQFFTHPWFEMFHPQNEIMTESVCAIDDSYLISTLQKKIKHQAEKKVVEEEEKKLVSGKLETVEKLTIGLKDIEIIESHYNYLSTSVPLTSTQPVYQIENPYRSSLPIDIPKRKSSNTQSNIAMAASTVTTIIGNLSPITNNIYQYLNTSIDNLRKIVQGRTY